MALAGVSDGRRLGEIIGEAFINDPVASWSLGSPGAVRAVFSLLGERLYLPTGHCRLLEDAAGTMWLWPNQRKHLSFVAQLAMANQLRRGLDLTYVKRALAVDGAMSRRRPGFPHMYLFAVGVLPEARGKGLGGAIIRQSLVIADALGVPSYLENSNPMNTGLYQRLGFVAQTTFEAATGCPPITTMLRPPGEPANDGL